MRIISYDTFRRPTTSKGSTLDAGRQSVREASKRPKGVELGCDLGDLTDKTMRNWLGVYPDETSNPV